MCLSRLSREIHLGKSGLRHSHANSASEPRYVCSESDTPSYGAVKLLADAGENNNTMVAPIQVLTWRTWRMPQVPSLLVKGPA
jgi:hypothetical protein